MAKSPGKTPRASSEGARSDASCFRCGRDTIRFTSWREEKEPPSLTSKFVRVGFCTWFCARAYNHVTGRAVEDLRGSIVIGPRQPDETPPGEVYDPTPQPKGRPRYLPILPIPALPVPEAPLQPPFVEKEPVVLEAIIEAVPLHERVLRGRGSYRP